jgi:hypothetical protein
MSGHITLLVSARKHLQFLFVFTREFGFDGPGIGSALSRVGDFMKNAILGISFLALTLAYSAPANAGVGAALGAGAVTCGVAGAGFALAGAAMAAKMPGASVGDSAREGAVIGCIVGGVVGIAGGAMAKDAPSEADLNSNEAAIVADQE